MPCHAQAVPGWRVRAGYVGRVSATLPLGYNATPCCCVELDELLLTIAAEELNGPPGRSATAAEGRATAQAGAAQTNVGAALTSAFNALGEVNPFGGFSLEDLGLSGQAAVGDSIQRIAGGLQAVLQQLRVTATNITLRIELPLGAGGSGTSGSLSPGAAQVHGRTAARPQQPAPMGGGGHGNKEVGIITVRIARLEACDCSGPAAVPAAGSSAGHAPAVRSPHGASGSPGEGKATGKDVSWFAFENLLMMSP